MGLGRSYWSALLVAGLTIVSSAQAQETINFDGSWEGTIHFDKEAFLRESSTPSAGASFRIVVHGPVVQVFTLEGEKYVEDKPGRFHIAAVANNAVIFGTDSSVPGDGMWTESWAFLVTKKDKGTLLAEYSRLVSNSGFAKESDNTKFATRGAGDLKLVAP